MGSKANQPTFSPQGGPPPGSPTKEQIDSQIPQGGMYGNMREQFHQDFGYSKSPYQQAAEAQAGQSHVGLQGPAGQSGWTQDPTTGRWTQKQEFTGPFAQAFGNLGGQIAGQKGLDYGADARQGAENAAYGAATSRLDPMFAQREQGERSMLAAQGLDPGSEAAQAEMGNFNRGRNDAYSQAQRFAVGQGQQAQQQAFGQSVTAQQLPYQQLQQLMGMMPGQGVGPAQAPNYLQAMGLQQGLNMGNADMSNQLMGGAMQNAGGLAGLAFLSDERAKQKIERLPIEVIDGVPLAIFEFRTHPMRKFVGVIAQDVLKVQPRLVSKRSDGLYLVDYAGL